MSVSVYVKSGKDISAKSVMESLIAKGENVVSYLNFYPPKVLEEFFMLVSLILVILICNCLRHHIAHCPCGL